MVTKDYIIERNGGYYVLDTRVSLDSVVQLFREGASPETILEEFPALRNLENVYGAVTAYLANRDEVERYLERQKQVWKEFEAASDPLLDQFLERLKRMKQSTIVR